ncbi:putative ATP-dependent DEAD/H RNA helicase [Trypanosoma theileri]|uniref:ATP-dependent RNA helicase n=1 Tax=Trypanosoma theileri TaxID=67003 RepID=A0A1X0NSB4_9TRYP|nr:putative ATP-dependent DEAD/H RNA helicase [Trypanosoma theileri]ORC87448.1 putative ATP-dependent DEAD/H RNA helicase [Trypanosoma theileri]
MKRCVYFFWRREKRLPRRFRDVPEDFTELRSSDCRPLVFTPKRPEPLRDVSLSDIIIDESAMQTSSLQELSQQPIAILDPERMGLPPHLVQYLYQRFSRVEASSEDDSSFTAKTSGFKGLTMVQARALQHFYARQDVALCAPTGTGKTFALCLALVARLMREGPMKLFSTLVLAQNDHLCRQIAHWMREMWWYKDDDRLVFAATSDLPDHVIYRRLTREYSGQTTEMGKPITIDRRPYVCVATPEVFWKFFQRRQEKLLRRSKHSFSLTPVLPSLDLVVVDEVDDVLPSTRPDAAGNLLMRELYRFVKYQAPVQLVFTSATLAGSTVNHVRRFLKKSVLESKTSRIFESEVQSLSRNVKMTGSLSRVSVPSGIEHLFYTADTFEEQQECLRAATQVKSSSSLSSSDTTEASSNIRTLRTLVILPDSANTGIFLKQILTPIQTDDRFQVEMVEESRQDRKRREAEKYIKQHSSTSSKLSQTDTVKIKPTRLYFICTASSVRGLDINDLTHVVILATPRSATEYAHWCGRVGRFGGHGVSVVIMSRSAVRGISGYCDALGIPFKMQRRYDKIDIHEERRTLGL